MELHLIASTGKENLFSGGIGQSVTRTPVPTAKQQQVGSVFLIYHRCIRGLMLVDKSPYSMHLH